MGTKKHPTSIPISRKKEWQWDDLGNSEPRHFQECKTTQKRAISTARCLACPCIVGRYKDPPTFNCKVLIIAGVIAHLLVLARIIGFQVHKKRGPTPSSTVRNRSCEEGTIARAPTHIRSKKRRLFGPARAYTTADKHLGAN